MLAGVFIILWVSESTWAKSALDVNVSSDVVGYRRTGQDQCSVCFGERDGDCFIFNSVTCEFYMETSKLIGSNVMPPTPKQPENPQLRAEVNSLLFSVMEAGQMEAKEGTIFDECLPYVSTYTNCDKENICMGCKTCECNAWGRWNCTIGRTCRPDTQRFMANHETLVNVIDSLKGSYSNTRKKRSTDNWNKSEASVELPNVDRIYHPKVSDWMNREPSLKVNSKDYYESIINSYFNEILERSRPKLRNKEKNTKLLKYVLTTLINDALPEILERDSQEFENNRVKRWITHSNSNIVKSSHKKKNEKEDSESTNEDDKESVNEDLSKNTAFHITFEELSEWLKDVHPYVHIVKNKILTEEATFPGTEEVATVRTVPTVTSGMQQQQASETPDYLAFEEVYNNVATEPKNYTRRKPLENKMTDFNMYDDMYFIDHHSDTTTTKQIGNQNGDSVSLFDYLEKNLKNHESATEVFVDSSKSAYNANELNNDTEIADLNNKIDNSMLTAVNIMKRDLTSNIVSKTKPEAVIPKKFTYTNTIKGLKDDVLDPIDNILKDKQKEIEELLKVRESLSNYINSHKDDLNKLNTSAILSIYKLEVHPDHLNELNDQRKTTNNSTLINKYLAKLKKDMFEVIRDIISIRKHYSDKTQVPPEFKYLIKAMNHYIRKTGFRPKRRKLYDVRHTKTSRRSYDLKHTSSSLVKSKILNVLELLDKKKPEYCVLMSISPFAQKLLKRIIKKNYIDDFAAAGLRMHDPNYNFTSDLKSVGARWAIMSAQIEKAPINEKLHNMKRLQIAMASDIAKVNDALALIRFAKGRRMVPVDESNGKTIVDDIHKSMQELSKLLTHFSNEKSTKSETTHKLVKQTTKKTKKRDSFLTQIKKMLVNSKKDILRLFKRKVPKTEIVKVIARKNIEEMKKKELEDTMHRWQTNLNLNSKIREKRSSLKSLDELTRRMKNIIPKYLRGKVPAIGKKSKGKKKFRGNGTAGHRNKAEKTTTARSKTKTTATLNVVTTIKTLTPTAKSTKPLVTAHM